MELREEYTEKNVWEGRFKVGTLFQGEGRDFLNRFLKNLPQGYALVDRISVHPDLMPNVSTYQDRDQHCFIIPPHEGMAKFCLCENHSDLSPRDHTFGMLSVYGSKKESRERMKRDLIPVLERSKAPEIHS